MKPHLCVRDTAVTLTHVSNIFDRLLDYQLSNLHALDICFVLNIYSPNTLLMHSVTKYES